MATPTITIVSLTGREHLTEEVVKDLNERAGMGAFAVDLFYFAPEGKHFPLNVPDNVTVHAEPYKGMIPDFFRIVKWLDPSRDWIFLEDDVRGCVNAVTKMARLDVPDDVGVISFFDLRHEWPHPGLWRDPKEDIEIDSKPRQRHLHGAQALKVPARVVREFQRYASEDRRFSANWDTWVGLAVDDLGLNVAHYAPSLVQHIGVVSVAYPNIEEGRPLAGNFPGETFDALGDCPDPIPLGEWTKGTQDLTEDPRYCKLHRRLHFDGNRCPKRNGQRTVSVAPRPVETAGPPVTMLDAWNQGYEAGLKARGSFPIATEGNARPVRESPPSPGGLILARRCQCPRPGGLREECNRRPPQPCPCECHP